MTKVLYVEDHEAQRDIMVQMLKLYGYEIEVACSGEEGVKKAREWCPDVILMDLRMPGRVDGLVAIRQLRNSRLFIGGIRRIRFIGTDNSLPTAQVGAAKHDDA